MACSGDGLEVCVENLYKYYSGLEALSGVSFRVRRGELAVLVGPNGSGKTTLLRILLGFLEPDRGRVYVMGYSPREIPVELRRRIGFAPERALLPYWLRVSEYLEIVAEAKGVEDLGPIDQLELNSVLEKKISSLSQGYRKRVQLAAALIGDPRLLLLDEPYSNIDIETRILIDKLLEGYRGKTTIIMATHIEPAVAVDRLLVLVAGRKIAEFAGGELGPRYIVECGDRVVKARREGEVEELLRRGCRLKGCVKEDFATLFREAVFSEKAVYRSSKKSNV